ncbi:GTPase ObgE [Acidobacteria bacterium AH-259-D05]|nr:GTPase ObgE [Acidobacteria bacterium AH-259-D05]
MFVDHAKIYVKAGDGGDGCVAFRREKYVPRGGPSGGDGGNGGNFYFGSSTQLNTLLPFKYRQHFKAGKGGNGSGRNRHGKDGEDLVIKVPVGTQVYSQSSGELLFDLDQNSQIVLAARGGRGGRGNAAFATATNQAPRRFEGGQPGEEAAFILELKILADVGIIGYPNAGKSTLISVISAATPKIAEYPFTTLTPNLGVVSYREYSSFVVADIPGLIEGAHQGSGLGHQFLRHVERTRLLVHLVDVSDSGEPDPVHSVETILKELELYDTLLKEKPEIITASKLDAVNHSKFNRLRSYCKEKQIPFQSISAVSGEGIEELKNAIVRYLEGVGD